MRILVPAALLLLSHPSVAGTCSQNLLQVSTAGPDLPANGMVLLEAGPAQREAVTRALPHATFVGAAGRTAARVVHVAGSGRLQVLLAPVGELPVGARVHLELGVADLDRALARDELAVARAAPGETWKGAPRVRRRVYVPGHKGDSVLEDELALRLSHPGFVLASFAGAHGTREAIYPASTDAVWIGVTGCLSAWFMESDHRFRVTLSVIDAAGPHPAPGTPLVVRF